MCATLRHLFPVSLRGGESCSWLGHTFSLQVGRLKVVRLEYQVPVTVNTSRQLQKPGAPLLCCKSLQVLAEAGAGVCVWGGTTPCMPFNNGTSFPRQARLPLGTFMALEPLTPIPPVIFMQPHWSFPWIFFLSPGFSTGNNSRFLSLGHHGWFPTRVWHGWCLGPQSLRGWRRPWLEGWASLLRWVPLLVLTGAEGWRWAPSFACYSTTMPRFCGVPGYLKFPVVDLLTPACSGCLFTANSCLLPGSMLQIQLSSTQVPSTTRDTQFRLRCTGLRHRPQVQSLHCPAFHRPSAAFLFNTLKVPFCPNWSLPLWESHLQLLARIANPLFNSFFLSFLLPGREETFIVFLVVWSILLIFIRCSVITVSFAGIYLMYLWGETSFNSSYSAISTLKSSAFVCVCMCACVCVCVCVCVNESFLTFCWIVCYNF